MILPLRCIPYKVIEGDGNNSRQWLHRVKVLMVSTPNRKDLVFPKVQVAYIMNICYDVRQYISRKTRISVSLFLSIRVDGRTMRLLKRLLVEKH